jgi:hypothetical protein
MSLFLPGKGTITVPSRALNDGQWHFVEITRNGRRVKVNVDRRVAGKCIGETKPGYTIKVSVITVGILHR